MPPQQQTQQQHIVRTLRNLVWYNLDNNLLPSAIFIAERLLAQDPKSPETYYLLALCYYRSKQLKSAEHTAYKCIRHLGCAYIFAQCCLELRNGKEQQGISVLEKCKSQWSTQPQSWNKHTDTQRKMTPDGAAVHTVVGRLYEALNQQKDAVEHYAAAVRANPFAWEAYERLCELGTALRVDNIFKPSVEMLACLNVNQENPASNIQHSHGLSHQRTGTENLQDPFATTPVGTHQSSLRDRLETAGPGNNFLSRLNEGHGSMDKIDASVVNGSTTSFSTNSDLSKTQIPPRKTRATTADSTRRGLGNKISKDLNHDSKRTVTGDSQAPSTRRSTRLLNTTSKITGKFTGSDRGGIGSTRERDAKKLKSGIVSRSRTQTNEIAKHALATITDSAMSDVKSSLSLSMKQTVDNRLNEAYLYLLGLFKKLGLGVHHLCAYRCNDALQVFRSLPPAHLETAWTFSKLGRVYFEMVQYPDAEKAFNKVRRLDPTRTLDMEVFSTLLWHLRKEVELAHLAHELTDLNRLSPQAWCAIGNSFSLQREHDSALKCFKRATQLDPCFAYAYTLQGHEHVANEEYGKALAAYRTAISVEPRHYNAWYGLGKVYDKQGKYPLAEKHFRTAAQINPNNSVLICCIGMILEQVGDYDAALEQYNLACSLSPESPLARFKKARVLMNLRDYEGALIELKTLKDLAPEESRVHFSLGGIYKRLGDKKNAIKHYTIALNLDPKAGHMIKEAIESLNDEDEEISGL
ncbi:TPR-like protein [Ascobolus immersus RN42]|uniref:TPR-like protein n=1 Tax=Ascobolus immersus RN42 TaxID=1160509 RepID=A0A3N4IB33_ASCIM|nr:TPR-like protein [Ascobolus immersus RN42]